MGKKQILIVEDDELLSQELAVRLDEFGHEVAGIACTGLEAIEMSIELQPDLLLMDIVLPGPMDGIQAAEQIQAQFDIPVVYLTAYDDEETLARAKITEPFGYLLKPYSPRELNANVAMALYQSRTQKKLLEAAFTEEAFNSISDALIGLDKEGHILLINPAGEILLGTNAESVSNKLWEQIIPVAEENDRDKLRKIIKSVASKHAASGAIDLDLIVDTMITKSVELRACSTHKRGSTLKVLLVIRDITERKKSESELAKYRDHLRELVQERTEELSRINQELNTYNYSVSHDLRSPLRAIDGFSLVLLEDHSAELDEQGQDYLQRIRSATKRMGELIDDLLMLSRISIDGLDKQRVDFSALAEKVVSVLREQNSNRELTVNIQNGISCYGDPRFLRILLENILGNAFKFSGEVEKVIIDVGQITKKGQSIFFVRDNGIGFDMAYSDELFNIFHRLHTDRHFEGTGIGMAIAERIVQRHNGHIWAEGKIAEGATFYFTLGDEL